MGTIVIFRSRNCDRTWEIFAFLVPCRPVLGDPTSDLFILYIIHMNLWILIVLFIYVLTNHTNLTNHIYHTNHVYCNIVLYIICINYFIYTIISNWPYVLYLVVMLYKFLVDILYKLWYKYNCVIGTLQIKCIRG